MKQESLARFDASDIIREHLENVKNFMTFQMEAYGRNASRRHINGLEIEVLPGYGLLKSREQWFYMETGRQGGKIPYGFQRILFQWVKDKGIQLQPKPLQKPNKRTWLTDPIERAQWQFAGAVAHKIMTSGTALFRSGVREDIYSSAINRECASILQESRLRIGAIISNINKNAL